MSDTVTLPLKISSNEHAKTVGFALVSGTVIAAGMLWCALTLTKGIPPHVPLIVAGGWIFINIISGGFFLYKLKPKWLSIDAKTIQITPMSILGMSFAVSETRYVSEFSSLDYFREAGARGGVIEKLILRSAQKGSDLPVDLPKGIERHQFVAQLGAALKLKVNDNA